MDLYITLIVGIYIHWIMEIHQSNYVAPEIELWRSIIGKIDLHV